MKSFQDKLPANKYQILVKSGKGVRKFLESHGCKLDNCGGVSPSNIITVYCGGVYNYDVGATGSSRKTISPKEFKRIVREALGESK